MGMIRDRQPLNNTRKPIATTYAATLFSYIRPHNVLLPSAVLRIAMFSSFIFSPLAVASEVSLASAAEGGEQHFQRCVACHLDDGAGIVGAFPPLKERLTNIVQLDGGRDYLTMVVNHGLMGKIQAAGQHYMGVMPAQGYGLTDQQLAALLNQAIITTAVNTDTSSIKPFSAAEISAIKARHPNPSMQYSHSLRPQSLE